ncbi:hypothetical protein ACET3Z_025616 [Daucus carota]
MDLGWKLPKKGTVKVNVHAVYYDKPLGNGNNSGKHNIILETEFGDAVREWESWRNFIDPTHSEVIRSLVHRTEDERLNLEICVVKQSRNRLARYLAKDGAPNRTMPVIFTRAFGRVRDLWHRDMGLGTTEFGFDLVTEEHYRKMEECDSKEGMGEIRHDDEGSKFMFHN